jgi:peptide/nickel transport system permease protein
VGTQFDALGASICWAPTGSGRDMLSRLIFGARNTVGIAFATTALAFVVGVDPGAVGGADRAAGWTSSCRASSMR